MSIGFAFASPTTSLDQLDTDDGLSQSQVRCMVQDKQGFMWFGTQDGLNRYNGFEFQKFSRKPFENQSLSNENILSLYLGKKQNLWVGTLNGLNTIDVQTHKIIDIKGTMGLAVLSVVENAQEQVFLATPNEIWWIENPIKNPKKHLISTLNGNKILKADQANQIYCASQNTLYQINSKLNFLHEFKDKIIDFYIDKSNQIWILTTKSIFKKAQNEVNFKEFPLKITSKFTRIFVDRFGIIWIGTATDGVFILDKNQQLLKQIILTSKTNSDYNSSVLSFWEGTEANEDIVWIGTREAGVFKYSRSKNAFTFWHEKLKKDNVDTKSFFSIVQNKANGYVWAGTWNGLIEFDGKSYQKLTIIAKNPLSNQIQSQCIDSNNNHWVGTNDGLFLKKEKQFIRFNLPKETRNKKLIILKIYEDLDKNLWICTTKNLIKLKDKKVVYETASLEINGQEHALGGIGDIKQDAEKNHWIATTNGVFLMPKNTKYQHFTHKSTSQNSLLDNTVISIVIDSKNQIFACTGSGITKITQQKSGFQFRHFTEKNGLVNAFIYGGLEDKNGMIWFSSNHGLSCFDPATEKFENFDANDGLKINEFNSGAFYKGNNNELFFGGLGGLISFLPNESIYNRHKPKTVISEFRIFEQVVKIDSLILQNKAIELNHRQNFFSIRLAALDFTNPTKNQYAYRLEGFGNKWFYIKNQRDIAFTDLPFGKYVLHIKSANNQGFWNESEVLKLSIIIHPPFWRTYWFYALLFCLLAGIIYGTYRLRLNYFLAIQRTKTEENERVRQMAAQDIHDEFGNSLTRISMLSELAKNQVKKQNSEEILLLLDKISDNSQRLYQGTKDFIWAINTDHDNLFEVAIRIKDFCEEILDKHQIRFECNGINEDLKHCKLKGGSSRQLVMIFKEAITNTLKHANADAVKLYFEHKNGLNYIIWEDNGIGISNQKSDGKGIDNMKMRAFKINAEIEFKHYKGTTISLGIK